MDRILVPIGLSFLFLIANLLAMRVILALNRRNRGRTGETSTASVLPPGQAVLDVSDILGREFEYARTTASEAMDDRHNTMNFYLVVVGVVTSALVAVSGQTHGIPRAVGTMILWVLCLAGWLYFLQIIRLRQAWYDSSQAMNQIKEFFIQHAKDFDSEALRAAFRWNPQTLPALDRPWTLYFLSAMLIALLNSVAFVAGGVLIDLDALSQSIAVAASLLVLFGLVLFGFHIWLYFAFLESRPPA